MMGATGGNTGVVKRGSRGSSTGRQSDQARKLIDDFFFFVNNRNYVFCPQLLTFSQTISMLILQAFHATTHFFHEQVKRHPLTFFSYHLFKTCNSCPVTQENIILILMVLHSHNRLSMFMIIAQMIFYSF